jgi:DNA-directed RNA polymerase alpha subunit
MKNRFKKKCSVNDDISVLGLSTRVENVLKKNNLASVGDVLTSKRIMYLPYLGEKSRKELRRALLDNKFTIEEGNFCHRGKGKKQ